MCENLLHSPVDIIGEKVHHLTNSGLAQWAVGEPQSLSVEERGWVLQQKLEVTCRGGSWLPPSFSSRCAGGRMCRGGGRRCRQRCRGQLRWQNQKPPSHSCRCPCWSIPSSNLIQGHHDIKTLCRLRYSSHPWIMAGQFWKRTLQGGWRFQERRIVGQNIGAMPLPGFLSLFHPLISPALWPIPPPADHPVP